jgi:uncharacterized protein YjbI with pentapeptide repeats
MPRSPRKLTELDEAIADVVSFAVDALFPLDDGWRISLRVETSPSDDGATQFELTAFLTQGRRGSKEPAWTTRCKKFSAALRMFARHFIKVPLTPSQFQVASRGGTLPPAQLQRLVLEGLAEAYGWTEPVIVPTEAPAAPSPTQPGDWPAVLRSGPEGLKRWHRLTAAERKGVDLSGAGLGGCVLSGVKLRGVQARGASFTGSVLAGADLAEAQLSRADFATADLTRANLKQAQAPNAVFRGARLVSAGLRLGMFFGVSFAAADLTGADLTDANLQKADLTGANLDGVKLEKASFDLRTTWPAGFVIPAEVLFIGQGTDPRLSGQGTQAVATDVNGLVARMNSVIDPKRMARTMDMLKAGKNEIFAEVERDHVRGIVRSQREADLVYSCVLTRDGSYICSTPKLELCMGLRGEPCKHILVLVLGLARSGRLNPEAVDPWLVAAKGKDHRWNDVLRNHVSDTLLRYKGVEAGEVDWRPTETIPEDFYAY